MQHSNNAARGIDELKRRHGRWWLLGLPALICLPCILPALIAGFLAIGGAGAVSASVSGSSGLLALVIGLLLAALAAGVYVLSRRRRRRRAQSASRL